MYLSESAPVSGPLTGKGWVLDADRNSRRPLPGKALRRSRSVCFVIPCAKYTGDRRRKYGNGLGSAIAGGDLSKFVADDFVAPIGRIDRFNDGDEEAL